MNYTITQASEQDWQLYKRIRLETLQQEPQAFSSTYKDALTFPDSKWIELLNDKESIYLFVFKETNVIGVGRVTFNDPNEPNNIAVVGGVYINSSHRKRGLGKRLLEDLIALAVKNESIEAIKLEVKKSQSAAINLYTELGFKKVGEIEDEIVMEKQLR